MKKVITIEWRNPTSKEERGLFGRTTYNSGDSLVSIFINSLKNKKSNDLVMTFWHEMTHAFFAIHKHKRSVTFQREEDLCRRLEKVVWEILR